MVSILLVSSREALLGSLRAMLPAHFKIVHLPDLGETKTYIHSRENNGEPPSLILLDIETGSETVSMCRQLCLEERLDEIPVIALVASLAERQSVLEAGADDYLLQPLLSSEVNVRLSVYLRTVSWGYDTLIESIKQMSGGSSWNQTLTNSLRDFADTFEAASAWLYLCDSESRMAMLAGSYNPPSCLQQQAILKCKEPDRFTALEVYELSDPRAILSPVLSKADHPENNGVTHLLSVPLHNPQHLVGVMSLGYTAAKDFSRAEKRDLLRLGQQMCTVIDLFHLQEETQSYITQSAFMILIARLISERPDPNTILSLTLEQAVTLLNASSGEIWLVSADGEWLELVSSLSSPFSKRPMTRRVKGQGLIGWVADQGKPLKIHSAESDPRFEPQMDRAEDEADYALLAVPLCHHKKNIGVLALRNQRTFLFANRDVDLLEGIANLAASALANARLMQELCDSVDQQRLLYEMSRQIAVGLDLPTTLDHALQWVNDLANAEISLLWLTEKTPEIEVIRPVATLGIEITLEPSTAVPLGQGLIGSVAQGGSPLIINNPSQDSRFDSWLTSLLHLTPRNMIAAPMIYRGENLGVISLFNKMEGPFLESDLTLLCTAIEMVALAVGNAKLHAHALALLDERERLHKQAFQTERLTTIGRLTASLAHEINNPMQAIRGALALALEELDHPEDLESYINLSLRESDRVVQLINRMRQIYRPKTEAPEIINLEHLLEEVIVIARKELARQSVTLRADLTTDLPPLRAVANELHLVFLNLLLNLSEALGTVGGGEILLQTYTTAGVVGVELSTGVAIDLQANLVYSLDETPTEGDLSFGLHLSRDIILARSGTLELNHRNGRTSFQVKLPLANQ